MTDRASNPEVPLRALRDRIAELEREARSISDANARHDVTNALGAARNAIIMLDEGENESKAARFVEIAQRNVRQAEAMIHPRGDEPARPARPEARDSGGDEGDDLGRMGERDDRDGFGL
jgi:hypothetical protein